MDRIWLIVLALLGLQAAPEVDDEQIRSETAAVFAYAACVQPAPAPQPPTPDAGNLPTTLQNSPGPAKSAPKGPAISPQPTPAKRAAPPLQAVAAKPVVSVLQHKPPQIGDVVMRPDGRYVYRSVCRSGVCTLEWVREPEPMQRRRGWFR